MNRGISIVIFLSLCFISYGQNPALHVGDRFPDLIIRPIINAPVKQFDVKKENKKYLILNFWGTWCVPCIPEMDSLTRLQAKNKDVIHVIAISNETTDRLNNYLKKRPTNLWLASDTSSFLYSKQFMFNYVGQSAIIAPDNRIIALVRTDSINQRLIDRLKRNQPVKSSAETGITGGEYRTTDFFGVDSSMSFHVALSSARTKDYGSGSVGYDHTAFAGRRITLMNVPDVFLFSIAFDISSPAKIIYLPDEKTITRTMKMICFDLLVAPDQKDSLKIIMQQEVVKLLPFKARKEKKMMPVYLLKQKETNPTTWKASDSTETFRMYTGKGFTGVAVPMSEYADYLENELGLPVIDETGLKGKYDIKTVNVLRSTEEVLKGVGNLGLKVEKTNREIDVLIIYK